MAVHKELFTDWKKGAVGLEFNQELNDSVARLLSELANRREPDGHRDMWVRGAMWAFSEMIAWMPDFIEEEGENADVQV